MRRPASDRPDRGRLWKMRWRRWLPWARAPSATASSNSRRRPGRRRAQPGLLFCALQLQCVPDAVDRAHEVLPRAHFFELAAQVLDVSVHRAVGDDAVVGVEALEELFAGEDAAGRGSERAQQPELDRRQIERLAIERGAVALFVQGERRSNWHAATPENRLDARHEL